MSTFLILIYGLGIVGVLGLFYLLKVPFNWFSVIMGVLLVIFIGNYSFLFFLAGVAILLLKEKYFTKNKNTKNESN